MFLLSITIPNNNTLGDKECQNITSQKGGSFLDCGFSLDTFASSKDLHIRFINNSKSSMSVGVDGFLSLCAGPMIHLCSNREWDRL